MEETATYVPLVACPLKKGAAPIVLDKEMYEGLHSLLNSNDQEDHRMAQLTLNGCDIQKSIFWLWRLAKKHSARMVNLRTKASRFLQTTADLPSIRGMNETDFGEWLIDKDWMTQEIFQVLEPYILQDLKDQCDNQYYDVTVRLKEEYQHLTPNNKDISFKDKPDEKVSDF
jgi:hypothetical protein